VVEPAPRRAAPARPRVTLSLARVRLGRQDHLRPGWFTLGLDSKLDVSGRRAIIIMIRTPDHGVLIMIQEPGESEKALRLINHDHQ
jgi:hypothetical protein